MPFEGPAHVIKGFIHKYIAKANIAIMHHHETTNPAVTYKLGTLHIWLKADVEYYANKTSRIADLHQCASAPLRTFCILTSPVCKHQPPPSIRLGVTALRCPLVAHIPDRPPPPLTTQSFRPCSGAKVSGEHSDSGARGKLAPGTASGQVCAIWVSVRQATARGHARRTQYGIEEDVIVRTLWLRVAECEGL